MITIFTRRGDRIEVAHGAAVVATELPTKPGNDPAKGLAVVSATGAVLAVFRVVEVAGYDLSAAGADA